MSWSERAREAIAKAHASLPKDATIEQRKKALFDAYPFGPREFHPYKMWLKEQRAYLATHSAEPAGPLLAVDWSLVKSPLDIAKAKANAE